jgi:hypothetical protein
MKHKLQRICMEITFHHVFYRTDNYYRISREHWEIIKSLSTFLYWKEWLYFLNSVVSKMTQTLGLKVRAPVKARLMLGLSNLPFMECYYLSKDSVLHHKFWNGTGQWTYLTRVFATPTILTISHEVPQFSKAIAGIVSRNRPRCLSPHFFQVHQSMVIFTLQFEAKQFLK